jgi:hypothetical protein
VQKEKEKEIKNSDLDPDHKKNVLTTICLTVINGGDSFTACLVIL